MPRPQLLACPPGSGRCPSPCPGHLLRVGLALGTDQYRPRLPCASITSDGLSILPLIEAFGSTLNDHAVGGTEAPPIPRPPIIRRDSANRHALKRTALAHWLPGSPTRPQSRDMRGRANLQSICTWPRDGVVCCRGAAGLVRLSPSLWVYLLRRLVKSVSSVALRQCVKAHG